VRRPTEKESTKMNKEPAHDVLDKTLDVVEENVQTVARIPRLRLNGTTTKQQITILAVTALTGAAVATVATYVVTKKRMQNHVALSTAHDLAKTHDPERFAEDPTHQP
jgi:hypothetical protein